MAETVATATTWANNIKATVGATFAQGSPTLNLNSGGGAQFGDLLDGAGFVFVTLTDGPIGNPTNVEIIKVEARSGDQLQTITRAQQGTTDREWAIGDRVDVRLTAGSTLIGPFLTEEFVSAEQVITSAAGATLAHGLAGKPRFWDWHLVCKVAELGYSIGDEIKPYEMISGNGNNGMTIFIDSGDTSNIRYKVANSTNVFDANNKTTGAPGSLNPTNWRLVIKAYR